jgi:hypothetical protein
VSRRALGLLVRDRRQEVDQARAALTEAAAAVDAAEAAIVAHNAAFAPEVSLALTMPGGPGLAAAYIAGFRMREALLRQRQVTCLAARQTCEAELWERAAAMKTLEKAEERLASAKAARLAKAQQLRLDEAATLRHAVTMRSELRS